MTNNIIEDYNKIKMLAFYYCDNKKYLKSLNIVHLLANFMYQFNLMFTDAEVEILLKKISKKILLNSKKTFQGFSNKIVFYDAFGLDTRGLALMYLRSLAKLNYEILYITYIKNKKNVSVIEKELNEYNNAEIYYIKTSNEINNIKELHNVIQNFAPSKILNYTYPWDVVGLTTLASFENQCERYLINLTDHAFWLGVEFSDYILEFRNFGANISTKYRGILKERDILLPYYPLLLDDEFQGFPFSLDNKKLIFSGGSLYKTLGSNEYYEVVKTLLNKYSDVIFLYAGHGDDSELKKIMSIDKFKNRIFHIGERRDLLEVLKRCFFYLSTYPIAGGLMTQYAVCAGKLPITLLRAKGDIEEVLLHPERLNVFFDNKEDLFREVDLLFSDETYKKLKEVTLANQLITENEFAEELQSALTKHVTKFEYMRSENNFNKESFADVYIKANTFTKYVALFASKKTIGVWRLYKMFPMKTFLGIFVKIVLKIRRNL